MKYYLPKIKKPQPIKKVEQWNKNVQSVGTHGFALFHLGGTELEQVEQNWNRRKEAYGMGKYAQMISPSANQSKLDSIQFPIPTKHDDFEDAQKKYGSIDPRSDKAVDHKYWEDLLWNCWHLERPLYYTLHGIRCGGGELTLNKDSFRLLPGEWDAKEWEEIKRQYLDPVKDGLINMLRLSRVGRVSEAELPAGVFDTGMPSPEETAVMEQGSLFK